MSTRDLHRQWLSPCVYGLLRVTMTYCHPKSITIREGKGKVRLYVDLKRSIRRAASDAAKGNGHTALVHGFSRGASRHSTLREDLDQRKAKTCSPPIPSLLEGVTIMKSTRCRAFQHGATVKRSLSTTLPATHKPPFFRLAQQHDSPRPYRSYQELARRVARFGARIGRVPHQ